MRLDNINYKHLIEVEDTFLNDVSRNKYLLDGLRTVELEVLLLASRHYYSIGNPLITNESYDSIIKTLPEDNWFRNNIYEEDIYYEDVHAINKSNSLISALNKLIGDGVTKVRNVYYKDIDTFSKKEKFYMTSFSKLTSMPADKSMSELVEYVSQFKDYGDLHISKKYNGWCVLVYFNGNNKEVEFAHNRGRATHNIIDMTNLLKSILPKINQDKVIRVNGELVISKKAFNLINQHNSVKFADERSILVTIISGNIKEEELEKLTKMKLKDIIKFKAFDYEILGKELDKDDTVDKRLEYLKSLGFDIIDGEVIENDIQTIISKVEKYTMEYGVYGGTLPLDGLVVRINNKYKELKFNKTTNKYGKRAFKGGVFTSKIYSGIIKRFKLNHAKKYKTINAIIEPIKTKRGTVSNIPLFISNIIDDKLSIGDLITFSDRGDRAVYYEGKINN